ncbi:UNVERIFIED_CONTAM: hypothetical protein HDU68_001382 [Siphonaria sp. JEL0065]|nr:hypothetical protein HDU68_001382 [Siphonaria sp. JEL0065]
MLKRLFSTTPKGKSQFLLLAKDFRDSDALARRMTVRQSHLDRAVQSKTDGTVLVGGATLGEGEGKPMNGSMLVLDFPSNEVAHAYVKSDPYIVGKVWETYTLSPFKLTAIVQTPPVATQPQFLVIAKDFRDALGKRLSNLDAHRKHLAKAAEKGFVLVGGPTLSAKDSESPNGSMFVFSAPSQFEVEEHLKADPFTTQNVWESYDIVPFKLAPLPPSAPTAKL